MAAGVKVVIAHPQKGQSESDCQQMAESGSGGKSYDAFGTACWNVYGKAVQINPIMNSVQEGFMITNINFHASAIPSVSSPGGLGGAGQSAGSNSSGLGSPGWTTDTMAYDIGA